MPGRWILGVWFLLAPLAQAACGDATIVRDWGLHRAWRVQRNCDRPERPAVLVEVPWTDANTIRQGAPGSGPNRLPLIRAGMRVMLFWQDRNSAGSLVGTALTTGGVGETVRVRSRFGTAVLQGVVRGPGWAELEPGKVGR
jgi:hypothetical protein